MADYDLAIIGGGINGTGLARDAAGRRLRVLLIEQNDLASGTSSASTKLVHGGLRYLEHGAIRLVREALREREVLLRMAPHAIRPLRIMLPPAPGLRSALRLRLGLFIYDMLGGRKLLPATSNVDLTHHPVGQPLKRSFRYGFEFSDCQVDDARLVVLNALDAAEHGADIRTRTRCVRAERHDDWELVLNARGRRQVASARVLVNAAGPWIGEVADTVIRRPLPVPVRLVKGSHIVVPRRFEHDRGYLLQATDGRVVFALPFAEEFTLVGTTDENFVGDVNAPAPDAAEILYLCQTVNEYFRDKITPDELVWSFAGVRSLYDDGANKPEDVTRDYVLTLDATDGQAPLLSVYGGKITTYRRLAEAAMARLAPFLGAPPPWTAGSTLPGGDFAVDGFRRSGGGGGSALGVSRASRTRGAWRTPMAGASSACSRMREASTTWGRALPAISPAPRCAIWSKTNGRSAPTTYYGGAAKLGLKATPGAERARSMRSSRRCGRRLESAHGLPILTAVCGNPSGWFYPAATSL